MGSKHGGGRRFGWLILVAAVTTVVLIMLFWSTSDAKHVLNNALQGFHPTDAFSESQAAVDAEPYLPPTEPDKYQPAHTSQPVDQTATPISKPLPIAFIVETEMTDNLVPLILHFASILGPSWKVILFTREDGWATPTSAPWNRAQAAGHLEVHFLPAQTLLNTSQDVSKFLTAPWLWEQLEHAPHSLLFQLDSVLCAKSQRSVEEFFKYDYIGAPISDVFGVGFNGGLSLRNPRLFLQVTRESSFIQSGMEFEDQWFYTELLSRHARMPEPEAAAPFSVESIYFEKPLGYHQPQRWQSENMDQIKAWCPEVQMLIGRRAVIGRYLW